MIHPMNDRDPVHHTAFGRCVFGLLLPLLPLLPLSALRRPLVARRVHAAAGTAAMAAGDAAA